MSKYKIKSITERILLNQFHRLQDFEILYITKAEGYSSYDCILSSGGTEYICEIKIRKYNKDFNQYEGYMIQQNKYDALMTEAKQKKLTPLYINMFATGVLIWNLNTVTLPTWETKLYQKNDVDDTITLQEKIAGDLLTSEAHVYQCALDLVKASQEAERVYIRNSSHTTKA
jgi:hypothetical protein